MRKTALNFDWRFKQGFSEKDTDTPFEGTFVDIPHTVQTLSKSYFDETATEGVYAYQKTFSYDLEKKRRLFVRFEGVMSKAEVYLNGRHLKSHVGGYTAFEVELTDALERDNLLTLKVDSRETSDHPPFGHVIDYLTYGGIYREVSLIETPQNAVKHVLIDGDEKTLNLRMACLKETGMLETSFEIFDGDTLIKTFKADCETDTVTLEEEHDLTLWTLKHPKLYTLKVHLNGEFAYETRFGVRTVHVDENHFHLNGEEVFLRGLNRHQSFPFVGYAMPASAQRKDADILKHELGATIVRSSHYPPSRHFLDRCDEIGLLVFTELPGWQHIGDGTWKAHAIRDLESLAIHDYNHPSVVIIGTRINESADDTDFYTRTRDALRQIDTSRPTGGVRFFGRSELLEDIYTLNDFTHRGDNEGLSAKRKMTDTHHPYLITEYNGHMFPTKAFDDETKRVEHAKRHFKVLDDAYRMKGVMGAIGWCMNDYNTHVEFGSNDHICHHGVLDMNRNVKYAAAAYASQRETPFMDVLSMMHIGDLPGGELKEVVVATNCDTVELHKNNTLIGTHTPSEDYKNLPHPPVIIRDLIGNQIEKNEGFSKKDAGRIKRIMLHMLHNRLKMRPMHKLQFARILHKYKMTYSDAVNLYTKYVGGWGDKGARFTFKGYKDGEHVATCEKGVSDTYTLHLQADSDTLVHAATYDVTRLTAELKNAFGERAFYAQEVIKVKAEGPLSIIGPSRRPLFGGIESVWIRTTGTGTGSVQVTSEHHGTLAVDFQVT